MLTLTDKDFQRLYSHIKQHYGIDLSKKKQLIVSRLSHTLSSQGYGDFTAYVDDIISGRDPDMVTAMLNKLTTNYTYFLREEDHFKYLWDVVLPELEQKHARDKVLCIWSAGCSSGEEPYTISMYLKEYFGAKASQWDTRLLATDISQKILNTAITASYNDESLSSLPATWKQKYFVKKQGGGYTVSPAIRQNVIFIRTPRTPLSAAFTTPPSQAATFSSATLRDLPRPPVLMTIFSRPFIEKNRLKTALQQRLPGKKEG